MRFALLMTLCGCTLHTTTPMEKLTYAVNPPPKCLVVLMPGAGSTAGDFEGEGFLKKLQVSGLSLDVIAANAVLGYYLRNSMIPRLRQDIVRPALAGKPYQKRWIMGMSMGGFGSLFYAMNKPGDFDGVFALAPFLGDKKLADEIREAGGLKKWQAPEPAEPTNDNYQRQLWRWLQEVTADPSKGPDIWSGWGKEDGLAPMDQLLGDALPEGHVLLTDGAHEWGPWNELVERFLKEGPLAKDCAP
jgi:pimeloyl-ACP methyl ester carboxylesterase